MGIDSLFGPILHKVDDRCDSVVHIEHLLVINNLSPGDIIFEITSDFALGVVIEKPQ